MSNILETIKEKCIKGKRVELLEEVKRALAEGVDAKTVMNEALIPAMSAVGEKYSSGEFFLPLWTDFTAGKDTGILDWYTLLIAIAALLTLAVHGSLWVALKTEGAVEARACRLAQSVWWGLLAWVVPITFASFRIQPHLKQSFAAHPWGYVFPLLAIVGLIGIRVLGGVRGGLDAFLCSCLFILGMLTSAAFGIYPYVLPSNADPSLGLTVHNSAAPLYGLQVGLMWFIPGMLLACGYFVYTYRSFSGKVKLDGQGHY